MYDATQFIITLNDSTIISLTAIFVLYNLILIQLAPEIKKFIKDKFNNKKEFRGLGK